MANPALTAWAREIGAFSLKWFANYYEVPYPGDKLELIELIWDSLPEHVTPEEVPQWHLAELAKRRAEADASPGVGKPWREALSRFEAGT